MDAATKLLPVSVRLLTAPVGGMLVGVTDVMDGTGLEDGVDGPPPHPHKVSTKKMRSNRRVQCRDMANSTCAVAETAPLRPVRRVSIPVNVAYSDLAHIAQHVITNFTGIRGKDSELNLIRKFAACHLSGTTDHDLKRGKQFSRLG